MRVSIQDIQAFKDGSERFPVLTAYDYPTAQLVDEAGIPFIHVGDTLGMVVLGYDSTVYVTMEEMLHHTKAVMRGAKNALVTGDLPFMSYTSPEEALKNAGRFLQEGGCHAVKLEGGEVMAETVRTLVERGIPVVGHIGYTPQSEYQLGRGRFQGRRTVEAARQVIRDAEALEDAGAFAIVLELVPAQLSKIITERLHVPTIGIGAGPDCDGQVQVVSDMLGLYANYMPRHSKRYVNLDDEIRSAVSAYATEVRDGTFPTMEHTRPLQDETLQELLASL